MKNANSRHEGMSTPNRESILFIKQLIGLTSSYYSTVEIEVPSVVKQVCLTQLV